ncbi:MAG: OsmC family protein [Thermodesulfobacteriota bacterium]|jgi:putative redox protein|nr:OsmC family protein [Thermodesulfobacteriota bacterium]
MKEVVVKFVKNYQQEVKTDQHTIIADEAKDVGGDGRGPDPYDLLLSALGSCTSMTIMMYARRKEWPLEGVQVKLNHEKIHATDCDECITEEGKLDQITKTIYLKGDLTQEQRERILEIADRCPVNRTLTTECRVVGKLG